MSDDARADTFEVLQACRTDLGMRRSNNQDALAVRLAPRTDWYARGHFFMVADGMGAHAAGELASKLAVDNIPHSYLKTRTLAPPAALRQAIRKANEHIYAKGQSSGEFHGMGTTCSCLVLLPGAALVGHVGDSRVYRARGGQLEQLTFDHSLVWEMAAASHTTADKVPACIPKNVITRSLGPHPAVNVDLEGPFPTHPGDAYLLCSDGLTAVIEDRLMGLLMAHLPPQAAVDTLIDIANLRGGPDNISVVIARIAGEPTGSCCDPTSFTTSGRCVKRMTAFGVLATIGLVVGIAAAWAGNPLIATIAGLVAAGAVAAGLRPRVSIVDATLQELGGPYGNGPYRKYGCPCDADAVQPLADTLKELLELEQNEDARISSPSRVNWRDFQSRADAAAQAVTDGRTCEAVELYSTAIRDLLAKLRTQSPEPDESGVLSL